MVLDAVHCLKPATAIHKTARLIALHLIGEVGVNAVANAMVARCRGLVELMWNRYMVVNNVMTTKSLLFATPKHARWIVK
jgi:hypothetical protein